MSAVGLSLLWYLESSEYLSGVTTGYGARLLLHEPDSYPYPAQEGIFIPASMETSIGLKMVRNICESEHCEVKWLFKCNDFTEKTFIARANGSYGSCEWGDDFRSRYDVMYTRRSCQSFCVLEDVVNTCGCFDKEMEEFARKLNDTLRPCRQNEGICLFILNSGKCKHVTLRTCVGAVFDHTINKSHLHKGLLRSTKGVSEWKGTQVNDIGP
ncbi:SCNuncharacterized [Mya arenaria]|uniref:SCNuncharacterized n=1 Tax=Mya arenaria TaxID=6604 RepID=A0ABY7FQ39_MYAAR|nr:SCNuncharacterized [Mya arenaria]